MLVNLLLSVQTRELTKEKSMKKLIAHGLTVEKILETDDLKLLELIRESNFAKKKVKFIK